MWSLDHVIEWTPKQHHKFTPEVQQEILVWLMAVNRLKADNVGLRDISYIVCRHLARGRFVYYYRHLWYGEPSITFFKVEFRPHVNFSSTFQETRDPHVLSRRQRVRLNKSYNRRRQRRQRRQPNRQRRQPNTKRRREKRQQPRMKKGQFNSGR